MINLFIDSFIKVGATVTSNPFIQVIKDIFTDLKGWVFGIMGALAAGIISTHIVHYLKGTSDEKAEAIKSIRKTLEIVAGSFFLVWLVSYLIEKFSDVA